MIDKVKIGRLIIGNKFNGDIRIFNSWIHSVTIESKDVSGDAWKEYKEITCCSFQNNRDISFCSTYIASLKLNDECCDSLTFERCGIVKIEYKNNSNNKFCVNQFISKTSDLCMNKYMDEEYSQGYRNFRVSIKDKCDSLTEHYLYSCELKLERNAQNFYFKCFDFLYNVFSNYGISPHITFLWIILFISFSTATAFFYDIAFIVNDYNHTKFYFSLNGDSFLDKFFISIILSVQYIFNLSSFFTGSSLLRSKYIIFDFWLIFQSLLIYVLVTLLILSVRRRYKVS